MFFLIKINDKVLLINYYSRYNRVNYLMTNTEISAFIAGLVLRLFSRKVLFINIKGNGNCLK